MPRASAPPGLRSAAFRCCCRFPSTLFNGRVEGKLHAGDSITARRSAPRHADGIPSESSSCSLPLKREQEERPRLKQSAERRPSRSGSTGHATGLRSLVHVDGMVPPVAWPVTRGAGRRAAGGSRRCARGGIATHPPHPRGGFLSSLASPVRGRSDTIAAAQLGTPSLKHRAANHGASPLPFFLLAHPLTSRRVRPHVAGELATPRLRSAKPLFGSFVRPYGGSYPRVRRFGQRPSPRSIACRGRTAIGFGLLFSGPDSHLYWAS